MYGAGDVRIENVPEARIVARTDALVRVTRACICGSDLWRYDQMQPTETGQRMGHEFIGIVDAVGADVHTLKPGDLVVAPFLWSDGTCSSAAKGCTRRACTAAGTALTVSTEARAKRFASRRQTARSSCCRSPRTTN
jgi:threonine dehydrogenase-like Zn-dependent dehydrogenase